jgi:D-arabinose 1-dehydrogenase-like Zn-dependent alcohol dehydrogenase
MVDAIPLEEAGAAYERMATGQARFRIVLAMEA